MEIEIFSVSRRAQSVSKSASAIFVITREDIRRLGVTSIPEALRTAPGVHVARLDSNKWSISIRGFNNRFSDKLLVMVDGRSVYTPLFSGVFWEALQIPLEDVERIEVIRGPGGTMWGSNAVNGVINIITMSAAQTKDGLATVGGGTRDRAYATARFGGELPNATFYRFSSTGARRAAQFRSNGALAGDEWDSLQGGFRADWQGSDARSVMVSGGAYRVDTGGRLSVPITEPPFQTELVEDVRMSGGNVLGRWSGTFRDDSSARLQVYYDYVDRREVFGRYYNDTLDFDFQHDFQLKKSHRILWGAGHRRMSDSSNHDTAWVALSPDRLRTSLVNLFIQDDIELIGEELVLSVGSKFEHNSYTSWETQPSASLIWNRGPNEALWGSVARAVRIPSRANRDVRADLQGFQGPGGVPGVVRFFGDPEPGAEAVLSYQAGYRTSVLSALTVDLAGFVSSYGDVMSTVAGEPYLETARGGPVLILPQHLGNNVEGSTRGAEAHLRYQVFDRWTLSGSYSWMNAAFRPKPGSQKERPDDLNYATPKHLFSGRSTLNLPGKVELDVAHYYSGVRGALDGILNQITPAYHRVDARLGWRPGERVELSLAIENLLDNRHFESSQSAFNLSSELRRNAHVRLTFGF